MQAAALNQIAAGANIVFQVAGGCGLGVLDAAKEKGVWGIGVDADQSYLGPQVLTSAMKRVDTSVYSTIQQVLDGKFAGGTNAVFSLKNDGVGLGKISSEGAEGGRRRRCSRSRSRSRTARSRTSRPRSAG